MDPRDQGYLSSWLKTCSWLLHINSSKVDWWIFYHFSLEVNGWKLKHGMDVERKEPFLQGSSNYPFGGIKRALFGLIITPVLPDLLKIWDLRWWSILVVLLSELWQIPSDHSEACGLQSCSFLMPLTPYEFGARDSVFSYINGEPFLKPRNAQKSPGYS